MFAEPSRRGNAQFRVASADYFGAMGIPVIRGRVFDARDTRSAPHVAVISAALAEERWPGEDPLGRLIDFTGMGGDVRTFTIVGYRAVRRTREIGVRVALGTRAPDVARLLVREGAMFAVGGVAIGLIVANGSTRLVARWLYGVGATDPMTFAAVAIAMSAVALAATWVPAYRASPTDAMEALRHD